ncbi:hypothetical protein BD779DRAFT_1679473 [Infundibulicybe gibba]|nr:hypothetical protein BD779DRAFT_1679473 [Infundibulicybe gibba]
MGSILSATPSGAPPSESFVSPTRTPRPLPNPQLYTTNPEILDEEEEYMNIDPNVPDMMSGYRNEGLGRGRKPVPAFDPSDPGEPEEEVAVSGGSKSFVGGFVSGLKRFPKVILRYGDKKKPTRKATYGTDITATDGTGNTLPQYASNPPTPMAGPSGVRYMQAIPGSMPGSLPQSPPTALSGHHRQFSMRVTPPSEQAGLEDEAQPYDPENPPPPQFSDAQRDRPITQVEFDESELAHSVQVFHDVHESITSPPVHTLPSPHPSPHTNQAPLEDQATITQQPGAQTSPSAVLARPLPSDDYRRMSHPTGTLPTTLTTMTSTSITSGEPSFSSELNPVHRFFHTLRKMPWVATERVTVDYRPGPGGAGN